MDENASKKKTSSIYELVKEGEKERESLSQKVQKKGRGFFSGIIYYGLPVLSVVIFMVLIFAGTVPAIKNGILDRMDQIEAKELEIEDLNQQIASLEELKAQEPQILTDLKVIDKIAPTGKTQVAKFVGEIADMAEQNELEEQEYASGETLEEIQKEIEEEAQKETAAIIHIPAQSDYNSKFENIESFLSDLYHKEEFIIISALDTSGGDAREFYASLQKEKGIEITIDTGIPSEIWTMAVMFEKFQYSKGFDGYVAKNLVPVGTEPDEVTLKYIRARFN